MKKNRYIPYGYTCRNGKTTVDRAEAKIIRHIYERYINGSSLGEIAAELTKQKIPYTEKTSEWNKARISRIIACAKYIGTPEYDPIIDETVYTAAINCKSARQCNASSQSESINAIHNRVRCGKCGSPMVRKVISKNRIRERWDCSNAECGCQVRIPDGMLLEKITILLNRLIENRELIIPKADETGPDPLPICQLKNELEQALSRQDPDEQMILSRIREIAAQRYKASDASVMLNARALRKRIVSMKPQSDFRPEYFRELIEYLTLESGGIVTLHTKAATAITERSRDE